MRHGRCGRARRNSDAGPGHSRRWVRIALPGSRIKKAARVPVMISDRGLVTGSGSGVVADYLRGAAKKPELGLGSRIVPRSSTAP